MRIGLFGGTFNPIHRGHLNCSLEVKNWFLLDEIYIIPSAIPPHKGMEDMVSAKDRLEMIELAVSGYPGYVVCDVELKRSGPSYTIDTVNHMISTASRGLELVLILGLDAVLEIHTWKSYMSFFNLLPLIVMNRPGKKRHREILGEYLRAQISREYKYSAEDKAFVHKDKKPVYLHNGSLMDISSSRIRELIKQSRPVNNLVPKAVDDYIVKKGLYK